jgi:hypothetical protein
MKLTLDPSSIESYRTFLKVKKLPMYAIRGRTAEFPDEYGHILGGNKQAAAHVPYSPPVWAFDYQRDIASLAIRKRKFAVFADPGLGKTVIQLEWSQYVRSVLPASRNVLWVAPLMVVDQTIEEAHRFYGDAFPVEYVPAAKLQSWLDTPSDKIGITNFEALRDDLTRGCLGAINVDESSTMKSMYGSWGQKIIELGKGLEWKLCSTGTPAPNDRIEYGNHAVHLDQFPTLNAFLARFFVNRGQTNERWELKPHALEPFYRALSHWCIFLSDPAVYGWKDNCGTIPPISIHIPDVELTDEQITAVGKQTGALFAHDFGGITSRGTLARIAKGTHKGQKVATNKTDFIQRLANQWPDESTIIWCKYNDEQDAVAAAFPGCANIDGSTPVETRRELIADFRAGRRKVLVSKSKILGFGLNLQVATKMIFSTCQDSYEEFYQCVKRANRVGSTKPLDVYIPVTELEMPMVETVLKKARMIESDTRMQERIFRDASK